MLSHPLRLVVAVAFANAVFDAQVVAWTTHFVARWSGGNKDLPAAVVTTPQQVLVAGTADGRGFSRIDGEASGSTWCAYTVSITASHGEHVYDSQLCTGGNTWSRDAAVTPEGELWVVGGTDGRRAPVTIDAYQGRYAGQSSIGGWGDAVLFKRARNGTLLYATYLGGPGDDVAHAVVADRDSGAWIGGSTTSSRFLAHNVPDQASNAADSYLARVDKNGQARLVVRLDGNGHDEIQALTRMPSGDALVAVGTTTSVGGVYGRAFGNTDAFVATIDISTGKLAWMRRIGHSGEDVLTEVSVLSDGRIVAAGRSDSPECPGAAGLVDGWIVTLSSTGRVVSERCLGGRLQDTIQGITARGTAVWITGFTASPDFPLTVRGPGVRPLPAFRQAFVANVVPQAGTVREARLLGNDSPLRRLNSEGRGITSVGATVVVTGDVGAELAASVPETGGKILPTRGSYGYGRRFNSDDTFVLSFIDR